MEYNPGTHIIASLKAKASNNIEAFGAFEKFIIPLIEKFELKNLGTIFHNFEPTGFTGVVCLSESHLSVHTWPEHQLVNLDIYLSNFLRTNDGTVDLIYQAMITFFEAEVLQFNKIIR